MRVLYIGELIKGSTSSYRAEQIRSITKADIFHNIDTSLPVLKTGRLWRSIGWRYKLGPLVTNVNNSIINFLQNKDPYDLIWVDKAVFFNERTMNQLRGSTRTLIHYTPDNAFYSNRSPYFDKAIPFFDFCITTKSFEIQRYEEKGAKQVLFCTQGFDREKHRPVLSAVQKEGIVFIGLAEESRKDIIQLLLDEGFPVKLAGFGWEAFLKKNMKNSRLIFAGNSVMGEAYTKLIAEAKLGLGLLSKRFPELHTTRTFEIPACRTALVTEWNPEIARFFEDDEVCYFRSNSELVEKVRELLMNEEALQIIADKGFKRVTEGGYDYTSIMTALLQKTKVIE